MQKLSELQKLAEQPTAALAGTEVTYEQKVEWLRPLHIAQDHWQELILESRIKPSVAYDYYRSVDGEEARALLLTYALGHEKADGQQFVPYASNEFLERYEHLEEGGLWCLGESVRGEIWGQLQPNRPVIEGEDDGRYEVKLKSGEMLELPKPKEKVRQYESIPTAPQHEDYEQVESLRSHFCFCDSCAQLRDDPSLPIVVTVGSKQGASIYSNTGYAAIALSGVQGGYEVTQADTRVLADHLRGYDWEGRQVVLWFDRDPIEQVKTQHDVSLALHVLGQLLEKAGAEVEVAQMTGPAKGKLGADEYLAKGKRLADLKIDSFERWIAKNPYVQELLKHQQDTERQVQAYEDWER